MAEMAGQSTFDVWKDDLLSRVPGADEATVRNELLSTLREFYRTTRSWQHFIDRIPVRHHVDKYDLSKYLPGMEVLYFLSAEFDGFPVRIVDHEPRTRMPNDEANGGFRLWGVAPGVIRLWPRPAVPLLPKPAAPVPPGPTAPVQPRPVAATWRGPTAPVPPGPAAPVLPGPAKGKKTGEVKKTGEDEDAGARVVGTLSIRVAVTASKLDCHLPDYVVTHFYDTILDGVLSRLYTHIKRPYSAPALALPHARRFRRGMAEARDMADKGFGVAETSWQFPRWA